MRISLPFQRRTTVIEQVLQNHDREAERQQRSNARQVARPKGRCRKQCAVLEELRPWATRNQMWFDDSTSCNPRPRYYALAPIMDGSTDYYLRYYENGEMSVNVKSNYGYGYGSFSWTDDDPLFWKWLRTISPEVLIDRARKAAYNRGAGPNTL